MRWADVGPHARAERPSWATCNDRLTPRNFARAKVSGLSLIHRRSGSGGRLGRAARDAALMGANEQRLIRRSRAHAWVFTRRQARDEGLADSTIFDRVHEGTWIGIHRGVYALAASPRTWEQRAFAAVLAVGGRAVLSHAAAAHAWRLNEKPPAIIDVTAGTRVRRRLNGVRIHATSLPATHATHMGTMPLTTHARTLLDHAGHVTPAEIEDMLIETIRRWPATLRALPAVLDSDINTAGAGVLRRQLRVFDPEHAARLMSKIESRFLGGFRRSRLPHPHVDRHLYDPGGHLIARVEFSWLPDLTVEVDGLRFHTTPSQKAHDDDRQNQLVLSGQRVLRYSARALDVLPTVITQIATALAHVRRAAG